MRVNDFWTLTPIEFYYIMDAYKDSENQGYKSNWEQTRMIAYYLYCSYPKKSRNPSYQRFSIDHIPFPWDNINKETADISDMTKQSISPNEWLKRISKLKPKSKKKETASANDVKKLIKT